MRIHFFTTIVLLIFMVSCDFFKDNSVSNSVVFIESEIDSIFINDTLHIEWESPSSPDSIKIQYSLDSSWNDLDIIKNDNEYNLLITEELAGDIEIRILDLNGNVLSEQNKKITVMYKYPLLFNQPQKDTLVIEDTLSIIWESLISIDSIKIQYSVDSVWKDLVVTENANEHDLLITEEFVGNIEFRILDLEGNIISKSNTGITVLHKYPIRLQDFQKDTLVVEDTLNIIWESLAQIDSVKIQYSVDSVWKDLVVTKNLNQYELLLTEEFVGDVEIRILDVEGITLTKNNKGITVFHKYPIRFQNFQKDTIVVEDTLNIIWESLAQIDSVKIQYSVDSVWKELIVIENLNQYDLLISEEFVGDVEFRILDIEGNVLSKSNIGISIINPDLGDFAPTSIGDNWIYFGTYSQGTGPGIIGNSYRILREVRVISTINSTEIEINVKDSLYERWWPAPTPIQNDTIINNTFIVSQKTPNELFVNTGDRLLSTMFQKKLISNSLLSDTLINDINYKKEYYSFKTASDSTDFKRLQNVGVFSFYFRSFKMWGVGETIKYDLKSFNDINF